MRASIVGIGGFTGLEILRVLQQHPQVELAHLAARTNVGERLGALYPHLGHMAHTISNPSFPELAADSDVVFLALPHKTAQEAVAALHGKTKVIDLSADYRLNDPAVYRQYYEVDHSQEDLMRSGAVVYGAPEFYRQDIQKATSVANPGCFALLAQLMLYPLRGHIQNAHIMAVTGSSGAGKTPGEGTHHPIRNHNMKSYGINTHRHIAEIVRTAGITPAQLSFVPTSGPYTRGIFATAFITHDSDLNAPEAFAAAYDQEPFIRMVKTPEMASIVGSNYCDISVIREGASKTIVQGVFDNLMKGAASNAVQNMNLMFGLDETTGIQTITPLYP